MFNSKIIYINEGKVLYNGIKMEMFIPDEFFKTGLAEELGSMFFVFGAVRTLHYMGKNDDRSKAAEAIFYYPAKFYTKPNQYIDETLDFGDGEQKYRVLTYFKDDIVMMSDEVIQDAGNVESLMKLLIGGKLDIVEYAKIPLLLEMGKYYNNVDFETPAFYEEAIISDYYRSKTNPYLPARFEAAVTKDPHYYARGITEREKVSFTSTFAGVTFEDLTSMLTMADNAARSEKNEVKSEVELVTLGEI